MQGGRRPADSPWDAGDRQVRGRRREKRDLGVSAKASLLTTSLAAFCRWQGRCR